MLNIHEGSIWTGLHQMWLKLESDLIVYCCRCLYGLIETVTVDINILSVFEEINISYNNIK